MLNHESGGCIYGRSSHLFVLAATGGGLGSSVLLGQVVILLLEALRLLLEGGNIAVLGLKLAAQSSDLTSLTGLSELGALLGVAVGTLVLLDLLLQTEDVEDHDVGAVEDEGEEQGEAAKVHVALRVELACLDFEALVAHDGAIVILRSAYRDL